MSKQALKFNDIVVNKKNNTCKQEIALNLVETSKIVISEKLKYNFDGSRYFIGYLDDDDIIRP